MWPRPTPHLTSEQVDAAAAHTSSNLSEQVQLSRNKMKNKMYHNVRKIQSKNHEHTFIHDRLLSQLCTGISITLGGVKLFHELKFPLLVKRCSHASVIHMLVKYQLGKQHQCKECCIIILNFIHNTFNLCDTVVMYNISSIKESIWPQPSHKYQIVHRVIERHKRETTQLVMSFF